MAPQASNGQLAEMARSKNVRHLLIGFTDLFGIQRAKLVPASAIDHVASHGLRFTGFNVWLALDLTDSDIVALPDAASFMPLPWQPEIGWVVADLHLDGKILNQAPRQALKRVIGEAAQKGIAVRTGVECEFYLTTSDGRKIGDPADRQQRSAYDLATLTRRYDVLSEMLDAADQLGWEPRQAEHEDANGQFEITWRHADALVTADRHSFFKYMARTIAERHGLRATFMPKPFMDRAGSGCHAHVSLWKEDANLFLAPDGEAMRGNAIAGILHSADALMAFWNPSINSYKRINAPNMVSSAIGYAAGNRTQVIRIPAPDRFELRLPDGAANPYLLQAGIVVTCIDGIENRRDPGPPTNMDGVPASTANFKKIPLNLLDALRALQSSAVAGKEFGELVPAFLRLKIEEWKDYCRHLTEWERENSLDC